MKRLWGLKNLLFDAVEETTLLVERTHQSVAQKPMRYLRHVEPLAAPAEVVIATQSVIATGVYATIRAVNRGLCQLTDVGYEAARGAKPLADASAPEIDLPPTPLRSDAMGTPSWSADFAESALNGFVGDYLVERGNHLDLGMALRHEGRVLEASREALADAYPDATGKIAVFVHGLSCTEWSWTYLAHEYYGDPTVTVGSQLRRDLGITPLFVRYNTGRHVSDNGQRLSTLVEEIVGAWPTPVEEITLLGHSMGGLVVRSAAHYGDRLGASWTQKLRNVFCIGSPHLGAPLEKATNVLTSLLRVFDTPGTRVPAAILDARSVGIKDLRFGYTIEEEWKDRDPDTLLEDNRHDIPFVGHAGYFFVAGCITRDANHPAGRILGDMLVRLPSAAGHDEHRAKHLPFTIGRVFPRMNHFHLANHPDVYAQIRAWCEIGGGSPEPLLLAAEAAASELLGPAEG